MYINIWTMEILTFWDFFNRDASFGDQWSKNQMKIDKNAIKKSTHRAPSSEATRLSP